MSLNVGIRCGALLSALSFTGAFPVVADAAAPKVLRTGHTDIAPRMVDGQLRLQVHTDVPNEFSDVDDTIFFFNPDAKTRLPDWSLMRWGAAGDSVWYLPAKAQANRLWPGFSMEYTGIPATSFERSPTLTLNGMTGPGEFIVEEGALPRSRSMGSRSGLPVSMPMGRSAHFHTDWVVSHPGVYCLNLRLDAWTTGGVHQVDAQQLTLVTAESEDPESVVPCADDPAKRAPAAPPQPWPRAASGGDPQIVRTAQPAGGLRLLPELDSDTMRVALVRREFAWPGVERDLRDAVVYVREEGAERPTDPWEQAMGSGFLATEVIGWNTARVDAGRVPDGPVVHLEGVTGTDGGSPPGTLAVAANHAQAPALSTVPGYSSDSYALRQDADGDLRWSVSAPGVYCVALRWTAELDGKTISTPTRTLTLAFDQPESRNVGGDQVPVAATIDPAAVEPCERRTAPEVPEVIDVGHVDIASRLVGGELNVSVADRSGPGDTIVHHDPSGTVLGVRDGASTRLPAGYEFLGAGGSRAWVLPQVQDEDLLWPGWSTDQIAAGLLRTTVAWTITDVRGPGHVAVWATGALEPTPDVLLSTRKALPQTIDIAKSTHAHANWGFTARGVYCLETELRTTRVDGAQLVDDAPLTVAVGIDPADAVPGICDGRPVPDATPPGATPTDGDPKPGASHQGPPAPVAIPTPTSAAGPAGAEPTVAPAGVRLQVAKRIGPRWLSDRGLLVRVTVPRARSVVRARLTVDRVVAGRLGLRRGRGPTTLATGSTIARRAGRVALRLRPSRTVRRRLSRTDRPFTARLSVSLKTPDGRVATKTLKVRIAT